MLICQWHGSAQLCAELTNAFHLDAVPNRMGHSKTNDCVMELFIMINALNTASAGRVTAVLPYFPVRP